MYYQYHSGNITRMVVELAVIEKMLENKKVEVMSVVSCQYGDLSSYPCDHEYTYHVIVVCGLGVLVILWGVLLLYMCTLYRGELYSRYYICCSFYI